MTYFLICLAMAVAVSSWRLGGPVKAYRYLAKPENKVIRAGVITFGIAVPLLLLAVSAIAEPVRYFQFAEVYLGVDNSGRQSPQCVKDGPDRKTTSNGGLRVNFIEYGPVTINGKYTHHSCAFNHDVRVYDAVGLEAAIRIFSR